MDPYEKLNLTKNSDGSVNRPNDFPVSLPCDSLDDDNILALSKDVTLNATNNTWLRLYLPKPSPTDDDDNNKKKLPIIIYFHGGGLVFYSAATTPIHDLSIFRATSIPALIVSVEYRLAPEHRLPAAYDDGVEALMWVRDHALSEPWLRDHGDLSNCYLMGCSAGGNIAYHCGLRSLDVADLAPLRISGLILNQPFFSGVEMTESEKRSGDDKILPLGTNCALWELSLPLGADRDHEYCNPVKTIDKAKGVARYMVKDCVGDPLYDRARAFAEALEREGASVVALLDVEGFHGIDFFQPEKAEALVGEIRSFIYGHRNDK